MFGKNVFFPTFRQWSRAEVCLHLLHRGMLSHDLCSGSPCCCLMCAAHAAEGSHPQPPRRARSLAKLTCERIWRPDGLCSPRRPHHASSHALRTRRVAGECTESVFFAFLLTHTNVNYSGEINAMGSVDIISLSV